MSSYAILIQRKLSSFDNIDVSLIVGINNIQVESVRNQLARIRDPLFQHLPVSYLTKLEDDVLSKSSVETTRHSSDSHSFQ